MNIIKYLLLLLFIASYSFANYTSEEKEFIKNHPVITVGVENNWPPFDFVENGVYKGLAKDYLDLISKKTNLKFNYVIDNWPNLLQKAKNKEIDLLPILAKTTDREKFLLFTKEYLTVRDYVYSKNSGKDIESISDFKAKTVALQKDYFQVDYFRKNYPETKIYLTNNILEAIDAVVTNKADFLVSNNAVINYILNKHTIDQIYANFNLDYEGAIFHMATRNDYQILRDIIEKAINDISSFERKNIFLKWMNLNNTINNKLELSKEEINYIKNKKTISVANELDWIPYDYYEDETAKGYVIDYIKLLCEKVGLEPIFLTDKWSVLLNQFKKGEIDILPIVSYNKNRESFTNYSKSYLSQELSIITKEKTSNIINKDDLKDKKIGMVKDWNLTKFFIDNYPNVNVIEFESLKDVFEALKENFVDATVQNKLISSFYINKFYYGELKIVSPIKLKNFDGRFYIGIKKDLNTLHRILNKAIDSVSKDELKNLDNKWINISKKINFTNKEKEFINKNIIQVSNNNLAPFNFTREGKLHGMSMDFWEYIYNKANLKTNLNINNKYNNALDSIKNKENDVILSGEKTKENEKYSIFTDAIFSSPIGIATSYDKNYIKDETQLFDKTVGIRKDSLVYELLSDKYPNMNFKFVNNTQEGLELLSKNNIYAMIDIMPVLTYNIKNSGYLNIKISGQTSFNYEPKFIIRNDYTLLKSIINKVLNSMTIEEKQTIYDKWIKISFEEKIDYSLTLKIILFFIVILIFILFRNYQMRKYQKKLELSQNQIEKSLKNFKTLIDLNIAGIIIIRDEKIKYLNNECLKILGYESKKDLINKEISQIFNLEEVKELFALLNGINSYEINAIKADNLQIPVLLRGKLTEFDNLPSHIISIIDLSEIKNKEKLILQQSKMASLGEMIGNIAHQWRQPLSAISATSSGLKLQKAYGKLEDEKFNEAMDTITETSNFLSQTIDDFRNYIKDNKEKKYFNIKSSIESVLSIMKGPFVNSFIKVEKSIEDLEIYNYENEFIQVLLNILSNSKDALKNIKEEDRKIFIKTSQKDTNLILEIIDSGGGIQNDIINKVFEPYFTTKHKSQGTGLGLYMTHKIIKESMEADIIIENCVYENFKHCTKVTLIIPIN